MVQKISSMTKILLGLIKIVLQSAQIKTVENKNYNKRRLTV